MNSKAIKRQLLAAIAMVLVAAIALGSSTYAWFASNNKVTADGISITAQSEGKLLIIDDNNGFTNGEKTTITMAANENGKAEKLLPTHPDYTVNDNFNNQWFHRLSDDYKTAISGTDTEQVVTNGTKKGENFYYLSDELYIKLASNGVKGIDTTAKNLKLSELAVTSTGGEANETLLNSVRIMLVVNDQKAFVYNSEGKEVTTDISADGTTKVGYNAGLGSASVLATEVDTKTPVKVAVYFYFDGRDEACTSANYDTDNFAVSLAFTADISEAAAPGV